MMKYFYPLKGLIQIATAAHFHWKLHHIDIKLAFFNGKIEENYVDQLEGFVRKRQEDFVFKTK